MAQIPKEILERNPPIGGLPLRGRGKVRDSYDLPGHSDKMLVVASNRISIFDFVLNAEIPQKGEVLTAINHFWTTQVIGDVCKTDIIACGAGVREYLPQGVEISDSDLARMTVVKLLPAPDVEDIVRFVNTGSGLKSYLKTGMICGHRLPPGLTDGNLLPYPIYTPTTKATVGHDEHITADSVAKSHGFVRERLALQVANLLSERARRSGLIMADTKFEFAQDGDQIWLADEKGTPDSSRFVDAEEWLKAQAKGKFPASLDKQYVREWGKLMEIDKLDPEKEEDVVKVHSMFLRNDVAKMTQRIYRYLPWRLAKKKLELYQMENLGLKIPGKRLNILVLVGSRSDLVQAKEGLNYLSQRERVFSLNVISCHRNPEELYNLLWAKGSKYDIIIAGAGLAAALPGIVKSMLCKFGMSEIPVLGVAFEGKTEQETLAAKLSIECLPGKPVELNEHGEAYNFTEACEAALNNEFLPKTMEAKPAELDIAW